MTYSTLVSKRVKMREKGRIKRGFNNQSPITPYQQKQSRTNVRTTQIKESIQSEIHSK